MPGENRSYIPNRESNPMNQWKNASLAPKRPLVPQPPSNFFSQTSLNGDFFDKIRTSQQQAPGVDQPGINESPSSYQLLIQEEAVKNSKIISDLSKEVLGIEVPAIIPKQPTGGV